MLPALLNAFGALSADAVLVLDDYHAIDSPAIHQALTFLLDHLPPRLHLVIASRTDPPLPLARLRALLAPIAGVRADRWDRRRVMILSDIGAALSTLVAPTLALSIYLLTGAVRQGLIVQPFWRHRRQATPAIA